MVDSKNLIQQNKWKILSLGLIGLITAISAAGIFGNTFAPEATAARPSPTFYIKEVGSVVPRNTITTLTANCNAGDFATGGGAFMDGAVPVFKSAPVGSSGAPNGWEASVYNTGTIDDFLTVRAVCVDLP